MTAEPESTIEFELTADELLAASRLHTPQEAATTGAALNPARARELRRRGVALTASLALAALLLGIAKQGMSMLAGQSYRPARTLGATRTLGAPRTLAHDTAAPERSSTSATKPSLLRFANPFDPAEVFEFPPGTSRENARRAVAEFLMDRARGRHVRHEHRSRIRRELRNS